MLKGIDVSAAQGSIDWDKVAQSGMRFAFVKVSEGKGYVDPKRFADLDGAREAGLLVGVYHFGHCEEDAETQAQLLWDSCGDTMPDLPPVLDLETNNKHLSGVDVVAWVEEFIASIKANFGRAPILYSSPSFLASIGPALAASEVLAECPLWIAQYSHRGPWVPNPAYDRPKVSAPWRNWTFWQYSGDDGEPVPGVKVDCDRNLFNGDERELRLLCGFPEASAISTEPEVPETQPSLSENDAPPSSSDGAPT